MHGSMIGKSVEFLTNEEDELIDSDSNDEDELSDNDFGDDGWVILLEKDYVVWSEYITIFIFILVFCWLQIST